MAYTHTIYVRCVMRIAFFRRFSPFTTTDTWRTGRGRRYTGERIGSPSDGVESLVFIYSYIHVYMLLLLRKLACPEGRRPRRRIIIKQQRLYEAISLSRRDFYGRTRLCRRGVVPQTNRKSDGRKKRKEEKQKVEKFFKKKTRRQTP